MRRDVGARSTRLWGDSWFTTDICRAVPDRGAASVGGSVIGDAKGLKSGRKNGGEGRKEPVEVTDNKKGWSAHADQPFKMLGGA
jgi:hypothetical protein